MNNLLKKFWLPGAGSGTSLAYAKISTAQPTQEIENIMDAAQQTVHVVADHSLFWYFLVGLAGALGGLALKILWTCLQNWFPVLQK